MYIFWPKTPQEHVVGESQIPRQIQLRLSPIGKAADVEKVKNNLQI